MNNQAKVVARILAMLAYSMVLSAIGKVSFLIEKAYGGEMPLEGIFIVIAMIILVTCLLLFFMFDIDLKAASPKDKRKYELRQMITMIITIILVIVTAGVYFYVR